MDINTLLERYGLNNKEAAVYIALIKSVDASAYVLSKDIKIPVATMYEVLNSLKEKNLVAVSRKNGKKRYSAESPNRLLKILKEKEEAALLAIPALLNLGSNRELHPSVKLYMGKSGIAVALDDITDTLEKTKDRTLYVIAGSKLHHEYRELLEKWVKVRENKGIRCKLIDYIEDGQNVPLYPSNNLRETRYISKAFSFDSTVDVYGEKVAVFSGEGKDEHAVIIESPSISRTFKKVHDFMWQHGASK